MWLVSFELRFSSSVIHGSETDLQNLAAQTIQLDFELAKICTRFQYRIPISVYHDLLVLELDWA